MNSTEWLELNVAIEFAKSIFPHTQPLPQRKRCEPEQWTHYTF
jgi:hypothetical protein